MNAQSTTLPIRGFSRIDLVMAMAIGTVLAMVVLAYVAKSKPKANRITCVCHLKQVGLSFRIWSGDHNDSFPMAVSTNQGGTMEFTGRNEVFRHFQVMSNELSTPRILVCPQDTKSPATSFTSFSDRNISYFVGLDAAETNFYSILSGDRNLATNGSPVKTSLLSITTNSVLGWTRTELHSAAVGRPCGNMGFGDGSVQQVASGGLVQAVRDSRDPNRLHMP